MFFSQVENVAGSSILLQNVESYAAYIGDAIISDNVETGGVNAILLNRSHIGE